MRPEEATSAANPSMSVIADIETFCCDDFGNRKLTSEGPSPEQPANNTRGKIKDTDDVLLSILIILDVLIIGVLPGDIIEACVKHDF